MEKVSSKTVFLIISCFALTAVVFFRFGFQRATVSLTPAQRVQAVRELPVTTATRTPLPVRQLMAPAAVTTLPTPTPVMNGVAPNVNACASGWATLARVTLDDALVSLVTDRRLILPLECLLQMKSSALPESIRRFVDECQLGLAGQDPSTLEQNCGARLAEFRAYVLRQAGGGRLDLAALEPADLANQLYGGFIDARNLRPEELDRNIAVADELIAREPNLYAGYKAKLLSLLQKELKYGQAIDPAVYEELYGRMTEFRGFTDQQRILQETRGENSEGGYGSEELGQIDADLVHIPFLRSAALGDTAGLTEVAESYIAAYPQSYVGYYYLAKSQWSQGDQAAAVNTFKTMLGPSTPDALALEMLQRTQGKTALERLQDMKIE